MEQHDLNHEFPEYRDQIHSLKVSNNHFSRLFDEYHDVNRHVVRVELNAELATDFELEELKKRRLKLKDELYDMLKGAVVN
ncbi:MAG TPA: YdcH family protein [Zoogloea sp.]|uniref:YdcH family protein n=1 Tax=Zoogloea sp. TaxID=49181 RepID=UPI002CB33246|nr:YdcH family protein [Zoogloea sp.]HMV18243.1 YdcH family protein [Rhodocyclaceae bacterium]HMV63633.1 YdcH family protein [Rhodocyclaceae bacterium]HMW51506.1 YdcH family protein [Rhodocyclaceae bacterium]HMY49513.1 YdcH family protein [Rhodocyclaceae bacterium]HMZ76794.1 YdcH family protein [Rhodocyclaceae bacterium]